MLVSRARIVAALFLLAVASVAAWAQAPAPSETFREQIAVTEVLLDVLVTDRQGNVIVGLGPEDFIVEEEGEELEVQSVAFYSNRRPVGIEPEGQLPERTERYFMLFFHLQSQVMPELKARELETARWAKSWVQRELLYNDHVAVLAYDVRLKVYLDFTTDKRSIVEAIDDAVRHKPPLENWPSRIDVQTDEYSPSLLMNLPQGRDLARTTRKVQQALTQVGKAGKYIVGRKNLVMFSVGFGNVSPTGTWQPDVRYYPDMKQALNNGNVAVYSIDFLPASRGGNPAGRIINDALSSISNDTGGHYYFNFVKPLDPMREVSSDNSGYYLLSYSSEYEIGTSGYRGVDVKTRNPRFEVRARRGYLYGLDTTALPEGQSSVEGGP